MVQSRNFAPISVKGAEEACGIGLIGQRLPSRKLLQSRNFALISVKGAEEACGIGFIGQRLPSRNPVHHTRSKMASSTLSSRTNGSQPAKAEIARERCWTNEKKKNIDRCILLLKNVTENLKNVIFYV